jgi:Ca2+/Na+ antiporter
MKRRISIGTTIILALAVIFVCAGVFFLIESYKYVRQVHQWDGDESIRLQVDLSKPGSYSGEFVKTCNTSLGEYLYVETRQEFASKDEALELVKGIKGTISVTDSSGESVVDYDFTDTDFVEQRIVSECLAPGLRIRGVLSKGKYALNLTVVQPSPALSNVNHALVGRNLFCGCIFIPAAIGILAGIVCIGVSIILIIVVVILVVKRRKRVLADQPNQKH